MHDNKQKTSIFLLFIDLFSMMVLPFFIESFLLFYVFYNYFFIIFHEFIYIHVHVCITKKTPTVSHIYLFVFQDGSYLAEFLINKGYEVLFNLQDVGCILY